MSRRTRSGRPSQRRVWRCASCRRQFSVLTATILQGTKLDVRTWIALFGRCAAAPDVTAAALARDLGVTTEATRLALGRIAAARAHLAADCDSARTGSGATLAAAQLTAAVLSLPAGVAAEIRARVPARRRPLRQSGPLADLGDDFG